MFLALDDGIAFGLSNAPEGYVAMDLAGAQGQVKQKSCAWMPDQFGFRGCWN